MTAASSYALITPMRDEEANLPRLAAAIVAQTVRPERWFIVDSGSTDGSVAVATALAAEREWIEVLATDEEEDELSRGAPVVRAFTKGLDALERAPDVVVKLDADVSMAPDHFERLLAAFSAEPGLGIASGIAYELEDGVWTPRTMATGTVWGAVRAFRWQCLQDVLPLEPVIGADGIDQLKANLLGWQTLILEDLPFKHHRIEGQREGTRWRYWAAQGAASHYMCYRPSYLVLRALHHARREPASLGLVAGYAASLLKRKPRYHDEAVRGYVKQQQRLRNVPARVRDAFRSPATS